MKFVQRRRLPARHVLALAVSLPTAAVVVVTAGDATATERADAAGEPGGSVTYAVEQEYTSYNNATGAAALAANTYVLNMVQPSAYIVQPDLSTELNTDLVTSVEITSEDPQVIVWSIDPRAVWSDGEPIDCDDFHLAYISSNNRAGNQLDDAENEVLNDAGEPIPLFDAASTAGTEDIESLECSEDGFVVTTTFSRPFVDFTGLFSNLLPAHVIERETEVADLTVELGPAELRAVADFWNTGFLGFNQELALSGGWYSIESFTPGETLILVRNEAYWGEPGLLDEIVVRLVPNATDQPAALANGDVQIIAPQPNPDLLIQLEGLAGITTSMHYGITWDHLDFNQAVPLLDELPVRQAIAHCIDREEIMDTLIRPLDPEAPVLNNRMYMPNQAEYVDQGTDYAAQDVDAARALMETAGFVVGSDGIYARDGERASFGVGHRDPNPRRAKVVELIAAQCAEAGIELVSDASDDFNAIRLSASDYDIALFGWVGTPFPSSNTALYAPGGGQNYNNYANPVLGELFAEANATFDPEVRARLMNEIDAVMWADMVSVPLFAHPNVMSHSDSLLNADYNDPLGVTWNANRWSLAAT